MSKQHTQQRKGHKPKQKNPPKNQLAGISQKQLTNVLIQQLNGIFNTANQTFKVMQVVEQYMGLFADMLYELLPKESQEKFKKIEDTKNGSSEKDTTKEEKIGN